MPNVMRSVTRVSTVLIFLAFMFFSSESYAQGVTTASMSGIVNDANGQPLLGANVVAIHEPSGTRYGASTRDNGQYNIFNMRIGGPYTVTASYVGYREQSQTDIYLSLGQESNIDFVLTEEAVAGEEVTVIGELNDVLNSGRTGAATYINSDQVAEMPSIKRSTRDLTRLDPRSDGNFSFGGKNWLYNSISLDGSYFNNSFGLDDPAPGGQTAAEPVPFDAVAQVQVSVAPYDVRQGGFTGAGINTVTKSGTNTLKGSIYTFTRNEDFIGNKVSGNEVVANPSLSFNQSGFTFSGPLIPNKLFFFINGEIERRDDPGSNFVASRPGVSGFGVSRVQASVMDMIRERMRSQYQFDPGVYEDYIHVTNNEKFLAKLDWNISDQHNFTFRYNRLNARRDLPPHPFVLSFNNTGRGPNSNSLPFRNSGYRINNLIDSFSLELNSQGNTFANRFFASYNRFRDHRNPFAESFPTIEIGEGGVTYTTVGHEPFSIHNILDSDVWQFTNNFSYYTGKHVLTFGGNFEYFKFFNSFNIFRNGLFGLPFAPTTFSSVQAFLDATDPNNPDQIDFRSFIGSGPFKGENIKVGQFAVYAQDELSVSRKLNLTLGLRVDLPIYFTEPVDNPFSRSLSLLDENGNPEKVDQSKLPDVIPLWSPRVGFNYDVTGDRSTQLRGGSGIFTGRLPFVWIGNIISNPGPNPNLFAPFDNPNAPLIPTKKDAVLQQSFDLNAMVDNFKWPQVWTSNLAIDQDFGSGWLGTLEFVYGKDINSLFVRNANLPGPVRNLSQDGRPFYDYGRLNTPQLIDVNGNPVVDGDGNPVLWFGGAYVLDNSSEGWNYNFTAQIRKQFQSGLTTMLGYTYLQARNKFRSTEIASVLWEGNPVQGDPNDPRLSFSEFGLRNRVVGAANYRREWSKNVGTSFGLYLEIGEGNLHTAAGGNRFSFTYAGDVNGDNVSGNDLIYIPRNADEINFDPITDNGGNVISTAQQQWEAFNALIEQDKYLSQHRGEITERFGLLNEWFWNLDLRILQDFSFNTGNTRHTFEINLDFLNLPNLINSSWGIRKTPNTLAISPLSLVRFDSQGEPVFNYNGAAETFIDDPGLQSRWQIQLGLRYFFN